MKTKTKVPEKERAAVPTTALKQYLQDKSYREAMSPSSLKSEIGILLLCLQFPVGRELSQIGWMLLERLLRSYIGHRISQSGFYGRSGCAESANARQPVSG